MVYNLTGIVENGTTIVGFVQGVNEQLMLGYLGLLLLITIGIICLIAFISATNDPLKSFAATSFICFILSIFLMALELIGDVVFWVCLIIFAISVALSFKKD